MAITCDSCNSIFYASSIKKSEDIEEGLPLCQATFSKRPNEGEAGDDDISEEMSNVSSAYSSLNDNLT